MLTKIISTIQHNPLVFDPACQMFDSYLSGIVEDLESLSLVKDKKEKAKQETQLDQRIQIQEKNLIKSLRSKDVVTQLEKLDDLQKIEVVRKLLRGHFFNAVRSLLNLKPSIFNQRHILGIGRNDVTTLMVMSLENRSKAVQFLFTLTYEEQGLRKPYILPYMATKQTSYVRTIHGKSASIPIRHLDSELHISARYASINIFKLILDQHAVLLNRINDRKETPFGLACKYKKSALLSSPAFTKYFLSLDAASKLKLIFNRESVPIDVLTGLDGLCNLLQTSVVQLCKDTGVPLLGYAVQKPYSEELAEWAFAKDTSFTVVADNFAYLENYLGSDRLMWSMMLRLPKDSTVFHGIGVLGSTQWFDYMYEKHPAQLWDLNVEGASFLDSAMAQGRVEFIKHIFEKIDAIPIEYVRRTEATLSDTISAYQAQCDASHPNSGAAEYYLNKIAEVKQVGEVLQKNDPFYKSETSAIVPLDTFQIETLMTSIERVEFVQNFNMTYPDDDSKIDLCLALLERGNFDAISLLKDKELLTLDHVSGKNRTVSSLLHCLALRLEEAVMFLVNDCNVDLKVHHEPRRFIHEGIATIIEKDETEFHYVCRGSSTKQLDLFLKQYSSTFSTLGVGMFKLFGMALGNNDLRTFFYTHPNFRAFLKEDPLNQRIVLFGLIYEKAPTLLNEMYDSDAALFTDSEKHANVLHYLPLSPDLKQLVTLCLSSLKFPCIQTEKEDSFVLHYPVTGSKETVQESVEVSAGSTPFHFAAANGNYEIFQMYFNSFPDALFLKDTKGKTCFDVAVDNFKVGFIGNCIIDSEKLGLNNSHFKSWERELRSSKTTLDVLVMLSVNLPNTADVLLLRSKHRSCEQMILHLSTLNGSSYNSLYSFSHRNDGGENRFKYDPFHSNRLSELLSYKGLNGPSSNSTISIHDGPFTFPKTVANPIDQKPNEKNSEVIPTKQIEKKPSPKKKTKVVQSSTQSDQPTKSLSDGSPKSSIKDPEQTVPNTKKKKTVSFADIPTEKTELETVNKKIDNAEKATSKPAEPPREWLSADGFTPVGKNRRHSVLDSRAENVVETKQDAVAVLDESVQETKQSAKVLKTEKNKKKKDIDETESGLSKESQVDPSLTYLPSQETQTILIQHEDKALQVSSALETLSRETQFGKSYVSSFASVGVNTEVCVDEILSTDEKSENVSLMDQLCSVIEDFLGNGMLQKEFLFNNPIPMHNGVLFGNHLFFKEKNGYNVTSYSTLEGDFYAVKEVADIYYPSENGVKHVFSGLIVDGFPAQGSINPKLSLYSNTQNG